MLTMTADDVRNAFPMAAAIDAMERAFSALHRGDVTMPPRTHLDVKPHDGVALVMPGLVQGEEEAMAVKVVSVFPRNVERQLARIQAAVLVFDPQTGQPVALLEGSSLTAVRTAAVSGLATKYLARKNSRRLAVFGAGVQAKTHIEAVCAARQIEHVDIVARTVNKAEQLADEVREMIWAPREICVTTDANTAANKADVICTVTTAETPVFNDDAVRSGTHINAVGSYKPHVAEIPASTVVRSRVIVDQCDAAWEEAGDLIQPLRAGLINEDHLYAELGAIVTNTRAGRENDEQVTLFKSVGLAVQDVVAASECLRQAKLKGIGNRAW